MAIQYARKRFTVDEYHKMAKMGILSEDDHVELIDGEIVEMTPIKVPHAVCVDRLTMLFAAQVLGRAIIRVQAPIYVNTRSEPQPDVSLLRLADYLRRSQHPGPEDIFLVVEVSDATLNYDRRVKMPLYARAGISEAWIVNIPQGVVEVYTQPVDGKYQNIRTVMHNGIITLTELPDVELEVEDILGRPE